MDPTLRAGLAQARHILVAVASRQACAAAIADLLRGTPARLLCLTQADPERSGLLVAIASDWQRKSQGRWSPAVAQRLEFRRQPADLSELAALAAGLAGVDALMHDANGPAETAHWMLLARRLAVPRLVALAHSAAAARDAARIALACGIHAVVMTPSQTARAKKLSAVAPMPSAALVAIAT